MGVNALFFIDLGLVTHKSHRENLHIEHEVPEKCIQMR
jgi:hypothetical protein